MIPEAPPQQPTTVPASQPQTQPAPQPQLSSPKPSLPGSQGSQRTPGSARNARPQRPSTFDIPPDDDEIELPRSAKRRKIGVLTFPYRSTYSRRYVCLRCAETPTKMGRLGVKSRLPQPQPTESRRNGDTTVAAVEKSNGVPDGVPAQDKKEPAKEVPASAPTDVAPIQPRMNGADKTHATEAAASQEVPEVQKLQEPKVPQEPPQAQAQQTSPLRDAKRNAESGTLKNNQMLSQKQPPT